MKNAFEEARTLAKDEKLIAELEKAIAENDVVKVKSLLGETEDMPSRLIEGQNIYRGSSKEYSLAKKHMNDAIEKRIDEIREMDISKAQQKQQIHLFRGRNKGYIEGNIENLKFEGNIRRSGERYTKEPIFDAYKVDKEGGINTENAWLRNEDTEYVMLSEIAEKLGAKKRWSIS